MLLDALAVGLQTDDAMVGEASDTSVSSRIDCSMA